MKNKRFLISFIVLFIPMCWFFYQFWTIPLETEKSNGKQILVSKPIDSSDPNHSINHHENSQIIKKKKSRNLKKNPPVFESSDLSEEEIDLFHSRRYEPKEATLSISGLKINRNVFAIKEKKDLPLKLIVPLPGGEGEKEFVHSFVDFQNKDTFVWVGNGKDNQFDTFHLSFYQGTIVGSIETSKGSYEIKQLTESKNIIRKINTSIFPENDDDTVPSKVSPEKDRQSSGASFSERGRQSKVQTSNTEKIYAQSSVRVDIVLGFSHRIKDSEGSFGATMALMNQFVSEANTTHRNSETGVVLNVRAMMELNVVSASSLENQSESYGECLLI